MKKLFKVLGIVVSSIILILLIAPVFISVDKFRPQIVKTVNAQIQGDFELGKLSLSLFPRFKVSAEKILVKPKESSGFSGPIVEADDVSFSSSLFTILVAPSFDLSVEKPVINFVSQNNTSNLESILPADTAATPDQKDSGPADVSTGAGTEEIPAWLQSKIESASFSLLLSDAKINYSDVSAKTNAALNKVNFELHDIGLNQEMSALFEAALDVKQDELSVVGPVKTEVEILSSGSLDDLNLMLKGKNELKDLEISYGALFKKAAGVPLHTSFEGVLLKAKQIDLDFKSLVFVFGSVELNSSLAAKALDDDTKASVDFNLESNSIDLSEFGKYVPMIASYSLDGEAELTVSAKGFMKNPALRLNLSFEDVQGSTPELSTPINSVNGSLNVAGTLKNPVIDLKRLKGKIGKNSDFDLSASVKGIEAPEISVTMISKLIDADEILGTGLSAQSTQSSSKKGTGSSPSASEEVSTAPLDESLDQMAPDLEEALKDPMVAKVKARFNFKLDQLNFMGATYEGINMNASLDNRRLVIPQTGLKAYRGSLDASLNAVLNPKISLDMNASLNGVQMEDVVQAHAPGWVGALSGAANGTFKLKANGFRKAELNKNLRGSINASIKDGKTNLAVIQVVNKAMDSIPKGLSKALSSKAKEKSKDQYIEGQFETMKLQASIVGRKMNLDTMDTVFKSRDPKVGKLRFNAKGYVTFDQDVEMLGTAYLSPDLVKVPELKGKSGKVEIPLKFAGKMYDPKVDVNYTVSKLSQTAAKSVAKKEAKKVIKKLEKKAPKKLKKGINDLKKKFGF